MFERVIYPPRARAAGKTEELLIHFWADLVDRKVQRRSRAQVWAFVADQGSAIGTLRSKVVSVLQDERIIISSMVGHKIEVADLDLVIFFRSVSNIGHAFRGMLVSHLYVDGWHEFSLGHQQAVQTMAASVESYIFT